MSVDITGILWDVFSNATPSDDEYEDLGREIAEIRHGDGLQTIPLLKETRGELSLDEEALKTILNPEKLGNLPIAVISIAGAFRMGKSFMLNFFLRYLQKEGWRSRGASWLEGWSSSEDMGIKWKGGAEGHTRGILALKEPIIIQKSNSKKLAVILLDTQGNFEHGRSREENVGIFALSTLFSSLQIFNISKQIQTDDMDYLQCFVEFAKISHQKESSDVDSGDVGYQRCFFQDLLFLVRDWQNPVSYPYGIDGGESYLDSLSVSARDTQAHKYLNRTFSKVRCFLMPEPSTEVRIAEKEQQILESKDLGKSFSQRLAELVEEFVNPDLLRPKTLGFAGPVTVDVLFNHVKCCANKILSGGSPEFPSLMKLVASHANAKALDEVGKKFIDQVEEAITGMKEPSWAELEKVVDTEKSKAKRAFLDRTSFGKEEGQTDNNLELFGRRIQSTMPTVKKLMQRRRHFLMEEKIKIWMDESSERLKFRNFPYTDVSELGKIRDERLKLLPVKDDKDPDSVSTQLEKAKEQLNACHDENVRDAGVRNKEFSWMLAGSAVIGVAAGGPVALGGYLFGQLSVGGVLGLAAGCGIAFKRGRDGLQKMRERFRERYSGKDKTD